MMQLMEFCLNDAAWLGACWLQLVICSTRTTGSSSIDRPASVLQMDAQSELIAVMLNGLIQALA